MTGGDAPAVGILGGTFNPPHLGHLAVARQARAELQLDEVLLMPAHAPPHKGEERDPGPLHRLQMCRLAVQDADGLAVCALEIERGGPSYTVDSLSSIHSSHPEARLTFIVGADTARTLPSWRQPAKLLELARLAVATRTGSARGQVLDTISAIEDRQARSLAERVLFLEMEAIEISSSMVRRRAERSEPIEQLVGPRVAQYIAEHGLYRSADEAAA